MSFHFFFRNCAMWKIVGNIKIICVLFYFTGYVMLIFISKIDVLNEMNKYRSNILKNVVYSEKFSDTWKPMSYNPT